MPEITGSGVPARISFMEELGILYNSWESAYQLKRK